MGTGILIFWRDKEAARWKPWQDIEVDGPGTREHRRDDEEGPIRNFKKEAMQKWKKCYQD